MPNTRAPRHDALDEIEPTITGEGQSAGKQAPNHIALSEDEAKLVHLVAEGLDVHAIAATTGMTESAARERLRALARRLALETGIRGRQPD